MKREFKVLRLVRTVFIQAILAVALVSNSFAGFLNDFNPFGPKSPLTETQKCNVEFNRRYSAIANLPDVVAEYDTWVTSVNADRFLVFARQDYYSAAKAVNFPGYRKKTSAERDAELFHAAALKVELEVLNGALGAVKIFTSLYAELAKRKDASKIDFPDTGFKIADEIIDTNLDTMFGGNNFQVINTSSDNAIVDELYAVAWQAFKDSVIAEMKRLRDVVRLELDEVLATLYVPVVLFNPTQAQREAFELSKLELNRTQKAAEIAKAAYLQYKGSRSLALSIYHLDSEKCYKEAKIADAAIAAAKAAEIAADIAAKAAKDAADAAALDAAKAAGALAAQVAADKAAADAKQAALTATTTTQTSSLSFVKSDPDPNIVINLDPTPSFIGVTTDGFSFDFSKITFPDFNFDFSFDFDFDFDFDLDVPVLPKDVKIFAEKGNASAVVIFRTPAPTDDDGNPLVVTLVSSPTAGLVSGSDFPIGVTTMTFSATGPDGVDSASFTITILDGERPIFTSFPDPINVVVAPSETSAIVTWVEPVATDNTSGVSVTQTTLFPSGSSFPIGSTTVTYKAVDASLNQSVQSFKVNVSNGATGTVAFVVNAPMNDSFVILSSEPKLNETIRTSSGTGRSSVIEMAPGIYPISLALPAGSSIEQASCSPSDSKIDTITLSGTIDIAAGIDAVCTISTVNKATETVRQLSSFIESRARLIQQHQPSISRRRERLSGRITNNGGISGFGINISDAAIPFNASIGIGNAKFSYSFLKVQAASLVQSTPEQAQELALAENSGNYSTFELGSPSSTFEADTQRLLDANQQVNPDRLTASKYTQSRPANQNVTAPLALSDAEQIIELSQRFDVWVEGEYTNTYSATGDGHFAILHFGADYLVNSKVLLGLGLQADWMEQDGSGSTSIDGRGFLIGPYTTVKLSENLFIDARIAWGKSYNKASPYGTYTDKFDSERLFASAALAGNFDWNEYKIEPEVRLSYYKETSSSYIDSLNVAIPSVEVITGTVDFGPQISRSFKIENGMMFTPFTSIKGIWTFEQENTSDSLPSRTLASSRGVRARVEAGFRLSSTNGLDVSLSGNYDGIGHDNLETWGTTAKVRKTF